MFPLAKFNVKMPATISCDCTCLGHLGQHNRDRTMSIFCHISKVAKASTVTCHCCWCYPMFVERYVSYSEHKQNMMSLKGHISCSKMTSLRGKLTALACHPTKFVNKTLQTLVLSPKNVTNIN